MPDSDDINNPLGDGPDSLYDRVEYAYNRQGQLIEKKDQNETVHQYEYDGLGRLVADKVTTVGSGIDDAVLRIATTYEVRGMVETLTSYDAASGGNAVNEVVYEYDSAGLLAKEYQEHAGAKDASTLYVQYNRDTSASGGIFTKGLRATSVRYPNGRRVHTTYGMSGSMADALSRVAAINDDDGGSPGDPLSEYTYLGLGTIVMEDYPEPDVRLDYIGDGSYSGFDRFGRVVDQRWYDYGAAEDRDRYAYGYDRASNRLYRENATTTGKDEFYGYDGVNRLVAFDRGDLNAQKTAISGTPVREEDWTLDPLGNWPGYVQKTSGTTDLDQARTSNKVNELTAITATTGTDWADPIYDRAGNMTTIPKPANLADALTAVYDAWNRLVEVKDDTTTIAHYHYDPLNRRTRRDYDSAAPDNPSGVDSYVHYIYNSAWQTVETRETATENDLPENIQPKYQNAWSVRYIDAPILRDQNTEQDGVCDDDRLYYLADANFNVTALVDVNGDDAERYVCSAYGAPTIYDGTWNSTRSMSSFANNVLYTGRDYDPETPLYHYRYRYYAPDLGAFISRDPIESDRNLYRYVRGNPMIVTDPFGLKPAWCGPLEALIRSFLDSPQDVRAWDNFVAGTGADIELTTDETESIVYSCGKLNDRLESLKNRCDYPLPGPPEEWSDTTETVSCSIGSPWALSIGGATLKITHHCRCRCVWFKIEINDYYDFDPKYFHTHRDLWAELKTIGVSWAQAASRCGWKEFYNRGFTHGKLGGGCAAFE